MDPSAIDRLLQLAPHTVIVHHLPGRIRLRLLPSGIPLALKSNLQEIVAAIPGVKHIRVNPHAASVVIDYDTRLLPPKLWQELEQVKRNPASAAALASRLRALFPEEAELPAARESSAS